MEIQRKSVNLKTDQQKLFNLRKKEKKMEKINRALGIWSKISEGLSYMQLKSPKQKESRSKYLKK